MKNKTISTFLGSIILLVIASGSYWYINSKTETISNIQVQEKQSNSITEEPLSEKVINIESNKILTEPKKETNVASDEMANWQTYTNTEYNFEFKYPDDWIVEENGPGRIGNPTTYQEIKIDQSITLYNKNHHPSAPYSFSIKIAPSKDLSQIVDSWLDALGDSGAPINVISITDVMLSNISTKKGVFGYRDDGDVVGYSGTRYYLERSGVGYLITNRSDGDIEEKIISTFKFY